MINLLGSMRMGFIPKVARHIEEAKHAGFRLDEDAFTHVFQVGVLRVIQRRQVPIAAIEALRNAARRRWGHL